MAGGALENATDIQRLAYRPIVEGRDVFGRSRTGTGKSLAFILPALQRFSTYSAEQAPGDVSIVILSPIKELSAQLASVAVKLTSAGMLGAGGRPFAVHQVIGKIGAPEFARGRPCDLLVATPGVASQKKGGGLAKLLMTDPAARARLRNVRTLVLDEGDSLTDGGFLGAIKEIASHMAMPVQPPEGPNRLQLLVFSATLPAELQNSPIMAPRREHLVTADTVGHGHKAVGASVTQKVVVADAGSQIAVIAAIASEHIAAAEASKKGAEEAATSPKRRTGGGAAEADAAFKEELRLKLEKTPATFSDFGLPKELSAALATFASAEEKADRIQRDTGASWKVLVFVGSALYTDMVHAALSAIFGGRASGGVHKIHGQLTPGQRQRSSDAFRERTRSFLVSTDASSRGVDYDGLTLVIQLGFTSRSEFLQRAGRVGRAGAPGEAVAVHDPAEARVVLREACRDTEEGCIGDMILSGAVKVLQAVPAGGVGSRPRSLPASKQLRYDPGLFGPAEAARLRDVNVRRVFATWIGGVASNWKRLKLPASDVLDWARRFAAGLGVQFDEANVKSKLKM
jgi:superfamily II DNA/RNA helicase